MYHTQSDILYRNKPYFMLNILKTYRNVLPRGPAVGEK